MPLMVMVQPVQISKPNNAYLAWPFLPSFLTDTVSSEVMKLTALLIDLSGTLHIGDEPTKGAVRSLQRLRDANFPFRFWSA
jgi:hypothetical protein